MAACSVVSFETKVYENDWVYLLKENRIAEMIDRCNYEFVERNLIINNVNDREEVAAYAAMRVEEGVIDHYYFAEDYAESVLSYFDISRDSFAGGYYYSISELVGIFLCRTPYLLHFSSDSILQKGGMQWIDDALEIMETHPEVVVANPAWNFKYKEVLKAGSKQVGDFYIGQGFSDQCYLVEASVFRDRIYNESHADSERYPKYGGELFEKRVDSYMRVKGKHRITHKNISYIHENFPKSTLGKWLFRMQST